jgi:hypothetical protein
MLLSSLCKRVAAEGVQLLGWKKEKEKKNGNSIKGDFTQASINIRTVVI